MPAAPQISCSLSRYIDVLAAAGVIASRPDDAAVTQLEVTSVTDDSRDARPGTLFVCKGAAFKREYLLGAISSGAVAYVSEVDYDVASDCGHDVPCVVVNDIRTALAVLADASYDHPSGRVDVCAFTGTKGKTTSTYYLRSVLSAHAQMAGAAAPAFITGVEFDDGVERGESLLTTPESFVLQRRIANASQAGCSHLVMEASSQAMKYKRTHCVDFAVGAFISFGEDHISPIEHPTLEDYLQSKLMLFDACRTAVVNLDMDVADRVLEAARASHRVERVITYSLEDPSADVFAESFKREDASMRARVRTPAFTRELVVPSPAKFNLANALAAVSCAVALGVSGDAIAEGLACARVPGRLELYPSPSGRILGVVDYAHNGMSVETLLGDLRESYPDREITVVFGATGGKGVDRRETMGVAAGKFADRIVITEDDPGPENPGDICDAIARAVESQGNGNWKIILDRGEAIRAAVDGVRTPSVVVVTGKGNDPFMLRGSVREAYEPDGEQLARALAAWDESH